MYEAVVLVTLGLVVQAAISLHVVEAQDIPDEVRARVVEVLCASLTAHTGAPVACERGPQPGEDTVAVRVYTGATRLLVRCDAFVGPRSSSASVELPLGGRESWRARVDGLWPVLLPAGPATTRASPAAQATASTETPWVTWALGAGSITSAAIAGVFVGLALDTQSELEATRRPPDEEAALLTQIDVCRTVAISLVVTAVVTAAAAVVAAQWDDEDELTPEP